MAVLITAAAQDSWPPRVLVSVTGLTVGDGIAVYRVVGGIRMLVRAGEVDAVTDTSFLRTDAELPFGQPVSYLAVVNDDDEYATSPATYALPGGKVAVTDAISGDSAEVVILAWDEKAYQRQSTVFKVGGRNVVVSGDLGMFEGTIELFTDVTSGVDNLRGLLATATEGVVQVRQPGGYDGVDSYLSVLGVTERRWSQDGSDPRRVISLDVAEVEGWAPLLEARGSTLAEIAAVYDVAGPNLIPNSYFETDVSGWSGADGAISRSTAQSHQGAASLLLTPSGSGPTPRAESTQVTVAPNKVYQATPWVRCAVARTVDVGIAWYTAAGVFISNSFTPVALAANTWTQVTATPVAPATAGRATLVARETSTPPNTHLLYVDEATLGLAYESLTALSNAYPTLLDIAQADWT
ncbi:carbohydrate binding domain-containing protein [Micromonospora sp. DT44]|uniref:carbohydrate binding domain-containing protein n=1 Tax=Micromonospora sp. DT44 TaxID=3393439 RepID=UPI003CF6602B